MQKVLLVNLTTLKKKTIVILFYKSKNQFSFYLWKMKLLKILKSTFQYSIMHFAISVVFVLAENKNSNIFRKILLLI